MDLSSEGWLILKQMLKAGRFRPLLLIPERWKAYLLSKMFLASKMKLLIVAAVNSLKCSNPENSRKVFEENAPWQMFWMKLVESSGFRAMVK